MTDVFQCRIHAGVKSGFIRKLLLFKKSCESGETGETTVNKETPQLQRLQGPRLV